MAYRSQDHHASLPPPSSGVLPPRPPPPQQSQHGDNNNNNRWAQTWTDNDRHNTRDDRRNDHGFRGPYSDLRQTSTQDPYPHHGDQPRDRDYDRSRGRDGDNRDNFRPPQSDFTFRVEPPSGFDSYRPPAQDSRSSGPDRYDRYDRYDLYRPSHSPSFSLKRHNATLDSDTCFLQRDPNPDRHDDRRADSSYGSRRQDNRQDNRRRNRDRDRNQDRNRDDARPRPFQRRFFPKASDRQLLHNRHDQEAELMLGDTTGRATYRDLAELSDSDEAAMDISEESGNDDNGDDDDSNQDGSSNGNSGEPARKRARTMTSVPECPRDSQDSQDTPKWSNPDPYTALPPPDETTRKKIDMVQLIRKARVEAESKKPVIETEADFISCDLSDDEGNRKPAALGKHDQDIEGQPGAQDNPIDLTASTSLGNRKRTFDDQIRLPHASLKPVRRTASSGTIVPDWRPVPGDNPCPWAETDHSATACMATRLHKEIVDFYEYVRPRDFEERVRKELVDNLRNLVKKKWPDADVYPFGSFMSGLYLPTADMDIAICSKRFVETNRAVYNAKGNLYALRALLQSHRVAYRNEIELITRAKVPLVKYADDATALKVDISMEKLDGHNAIRTFLDWKAQYPAMPILVSLVKHFLLMRGLNEPVNGGIGGFSVICLVVHLLNSLPQVQSGSMVPEHHLGELLMEFFDYYGNRFNYQTVAIRMNPPGLVNKSQASEVLYRNLDRLSILDPNNPENDIAGGSANTAAILRRFSEAHALLRERMSSLAGKDGLLLAPVLGGGYHNFQIQRDYLERVASLGGLKSQKPRKRDVSR